jgi:hypothetical protein
MLVWHLGFLKTPWHAENARTPKTGMWSLKCSESSNPTAATPNPSFHSFGNIARIPLPFV